MQYYICHEDKEQPKNGIAFFGPFEEDEIEERALDQYADALIGDRNEVDVVYVEDSEMEGIHINSREYWMEQLAKLETEDDSEG